MNVQSATYARLGGSEISVCYIAMLCIVVYSENVELKVLIYMLLFSRYLLLFAVMNCKCSSDIIIKI